MAGTKIRTPKATDLLQQDHEKVKELFEEYEDLDETDVTGRRMLFGTLKRELTVHAQIEEHVFYPAIAGLREKGDAEALVREAQEEHKIVKTLLEELGHLNPEDKDFDAKMSVLCESVEHHADDEEKHLFRLFRKLDRERQDEISRTLWEMKQKLTAGEGEFEIEL
jgi:hemerythrin superfamily protein